MARVVHHHEAPDRFVAGTVGQPGQRSFFLQARSADLLTTVSLEKEQEAEKGSGFLGTGWGKGSVIEKAKKEVERWKQEEEQIELRVQKTLPLVKPLKPTRSGWMSV